VFTYKSSFFRIVFIAFLLLFISCKEKSNDSSLPIGNTCQMEVFSKYQQIMKLPAEDTMRFICLQKLIKQTDPSCLDYAIDSILNKIVYTWLSHPEREKDIIDILSWLGNNKAVSEKIRAKAFINICMLYSYKEDNPKMDSLLRLAWQFNQSFDNLTQRQYCNSYGLCKMWEDSIPEASESFAKGIALGDAVKAADQTMSNLYGNFAHTYYEILEFDKAVVLWKKNLNLLETTIKDKTEMPFVCVNLGSAFSYLKQPDSAKVYLEKGIPYALKSGKTNNILLIYLYGNLGDIFIENGQFDSARYYLGKCNPSDTFGSNDNERIAIFTSNVVANAPIKDVTKEVAQLKAILPQIPKKYNLGILESTLDALRRIAIIKKQPQDALFYTDKLDSFREAQSSITNKKIVHGMEIKYETAKKDLQLKNQQTDIEQKRNWIIWLTGILLLGASASLLISFWRNLQRRRKEAIQQQLYTSQLIAKTEEERTRIARDLHDGVSQELMLLKESIVKGNASANTVEAIIQDIRGISRNLHPEMLDKIGLQKSLEYLCQQVMDNNKLFISWEIENFALLGKDVELQIFRIVQECFNNIVKHAKAEAAKLSINQRSNFLYLEIKDNGSGFDIETALNSGKSFGLHSILARCEAINGKASVKSSTGGTFINIIIPYK